jgi:hypothetical protein
VTSGFVVSWLIAGGAPLPHIQARLGQESITTTIDTYGHLLPAGSDLISRIIDTALRGEEIHPMPTIRLIHGGMSDAGGYGAPAEGAGSGQLGDLDVTMG